MESCAFNEENTVLDPPKGIKPSECESISVCMCHTQSGMPVTVSCWKVTNEELKIIQRTGRVWLTVMGHGMMPVFLSAEKPIEDQT